MRINDMRAYGTGLTAERFPRASRTPLAVQWLWWAFQSQTARRPGGRPC